MPTTFGWGEYLGGFKFPGSQASSGRITIVPRDCIWVCFVVTGYGGSDIVSLRFHGDTGDNYQTRYITAAIASTTLTNVATLTTGFLRLAGVSLATRRSGLVQIANIAAANKVCSVNVMDDTSAVGTEPVAEIAGGGTWFNTTAQITDIEMTTQ